LDIYLRKKRLRFQPIVGDGNCLFRALADQLHSDQYYHMDVRRNIIYHMRANSELFRKFIFNETSFDEYLYKMAQPYTWGDNLCIQAFCDIYSLNVNIIEMTSHGDMRETMIEPRNFLYRQNYQRVLNLLFDGLHYDSLKYF
jgi:hypothetical protein